MIVLFMTAALSTAAIPDVTDKQRCAEKQRADGGIPYTECTINPPDWEAERVYPTPVQEGKGDQLQGPGM